MFIPSVIVLSVFVALLRGGRLANLMPLQVKYIWLFFVPLLLQIIAFTSWGDIPISGVPLARYLYAVSMLIAIVGLVLNRHLPGVLVIAAGLALNFIVINLNGGFMPVSAAARQFAGLPPLTGRESNVVPMSDSTILPWLTDSIPLPPFLPLANVLSPGDLLILIGGIIFTQRALVPPKAEPNNSVN